MNYGFLSLVSHYDCTTDGHWRHVKFGTTNLTIHVFKWYVDYDNVSEMEFHGHDDCFLWYYVLNGDFHGHIYDCKVVSNLVF